MNFTFDASKAQTNVTSSGDAAATGGLPSFSFGTAGSGDAAKPASTGFSLMAGSTPTKPGGLFGTGLSTPPTQGTGFSFGGAPNAAVPSLSTPLGGSITTSQAPGLTFGATAAPSTGISFGATSAAPTTGFPTATAVPGTTSGFSLGGPIPATAPPTGLTFGAKPAATAFALGGGEASAPIGTGLTFGTPNTMTTGTGFGLGSTPTSTTASTTTTTAAGFSVGSNVASTTGPGLSLDSSKTSTVQSGFSFIPTIMPVRSESGFGNIAATTASTGFALSGTGTTSAGPGFSFGTGTTAASTTGFALNKTVSAAVPSSLATANTQISLGTTTTVSSSTSGTQQAAINFFQLEESINKWTLELEEQEKVFVNQAAQVNTWDKLLITNGEKIVTLNQEIERVKIEQQQLEHELDYVVGQQKELQDCLVPLEKELASLSVSDPEREYTYRLAENLDTQLKQMSEDLKEIIEHLNEANRTQDSSDPIVQIGKILNAHMNSLQWLNQQTGLLTQKIQQIDQMHQNFRQEHERNLSLAYN